MRKKITLIFHRSCMSLTSFFFLLLHYITPSQFFNNHMLGQFFNNHKKWKDFYLCVNRNTFFKKNNKKIIMNDILSDKNSSRRTLEIHRYASLFLFSCYSNPCHSTKESNFHFKRYLNGRHF